MKKIVFLIALLITITSCSSIQVYTDYEKTTDFSTYKTFGFSKKALDEVPLNDIDKRRIMRALSENLQNKGMEKNLQPDVIVTFFTKETQRVDVWQDAWGGWGFGMWGWWGPGMWGPQVSVYTEGTLYVDIIDARKNELIWHGQGNGILVKNPKKREANINKFVQQIIAKYPN